MSVFGGLLKAIPKGWAWEVGGGEPSDNGQFFARIASPDYEIVTWGKGECWITDNVSGVQFTARASSPTKALREVIAAAQGIEAGTDETPQEVRPEGQEPDPEGDAPVTPSSGCVWFDLGRPCQNAECPICPDTGAIQYTQESRDAAD